MERRLAAILAADAVGYSRLMGLDEEAALAALSERRSVIDQFTDPVPHVAEKAREVAKKIGLEVASQEGGESG